MPGVHDRNLTEGYLTQPMITAQVLSPNRRLIADMTLNFEGVTVDRGELNGACTVKGM